MSQFFYSRKQLSKTPEGEERLLVMTDSFNINSVVRTLEYEPGKLVVMLNDGHEEARTVPVYSRTNKETGEKRERQWVVSEIYLDGEDVDRFRQVFGYTPKVAVEVLNDPAAVQLEIPFGK